MLAFNIGLVTWETILNIRKGVNYGYPLREGTNMMSSTTASARSRRTTRFRSRFRTRSRAAPSSPPIRWCITRIRTGGGDGIAGGFVYHGKQIPGLRNKLVFGDITTGRIWHTELAEVLAADDGVATTVAPIHEMEVGLRRLVEDTYRARGGKGQTLPGVAVVSGRGRVDLRFAEDNEGSCTS